MTNFIDAKGQACPIPVVLARQAITAGADALTIEVDNATAVENLKRLAGSLGMAITVREIEGGFAADLLRDGAAPPAPAQAPLEVLSCSGSGWSVFVGRDIIGSGDRELGGNLMRMFFYTLVQSEDLPRSILFMNDGVKLPVGDSQVVEHLNALQGKGVEVLVCGTCLNFYGLTEQLQTGTVSNMFDIVSAMQAAGKVITL